MLLNLKDNPAMASQAYDRMKPMFAKYGIQAPPVLDQTVMDTAFKLSEASRGGRQDNTPADVRSLQWKIQRLQDPNITPQEKQAIEISLKTQAGAVPVGFKWDDYGKGWIEDKNNRTVTPATTELPPQGQGGGDPMADVNARLEQGIQLRKEAGWPADKINAWAESEWQKGEAQVQQNGVIEQGTPQQAQVGVKPDASQTITPYQQQQLDFQNKKYNQDQADRKAKADNVAALKADATQKKKDAVIQNTDLLINNIDAIRANPGYKNLGTVTGDFYSNVPLARTDEKDAQQTLDNIGGQVALTTMNNLKTLSAAGATGFGALSAPELTLLKNSVAALEAGKLSHEALDKNLETVYIYMKKIKEANTTAPRTPPPQDDDIEALLATYGNK